MTDARHETARFTAGLSEVVLVVENVPAAVHFYAEIVGLVPETVSDWGAFFWSGEPGQSPRLGLVSREQTSLRERLGEEEGAIVAGGEGPDPLSFLPAQLGPTHFAIRVARDRIDDAVEQLTSHSVTVAGPVDLRWMKAVGYFFLDPDGHLVELWSPDP